MVTGQRMHRRVGARGVAIALLTVAVVAAGCGAKGEEKGSDDTGTTASTVVTGTGPTFGTLASPCGAAPQGKKVSIKADEAGKGADKFYLGVGNDRTFDLRPGLLKELWDAANAFADWCNQQGGIAGIPVELVDLDAKFFQVDAAMTTACTSVFALAGGGFVQDNLMFSGKDGSDFHKCRLIAFPGFAVSGEFSEANGVVQAIPNTIHRKSNTFVQALASQYPEQVRKTTHVFGDIPTIQSNKDQNFLTEKTVPAFGFVDDIPYSISGQDWSLVAQKVIQEGATAVNFVGEPENMSAMLAKLKDQNYKGIVFAEANHYDEKLFSAGPDLAAGALIRLATHPFEEADKWPATKQLVDLITKDPSRKLASLSIQSFSSMLLFATAVNGCIKSGSGEVTRECVMKAGLRIHEWDGGGLHVVTDPGANEPPVCVMIMEAEKGAKFKRAYPEIGSKDDDADGFRCIKDSIVDISGPALKAGVVDPSLPY